MSFEVAELGRRLANLVVLGKVSEVDHETARVKVTAGELVTAWRPWLALRAGGNSGWHPPEIGEQVVLLSVNGDPAQSVVLVGLYQDAHPAPSNDPDVHLHQYADGTVILYDRKQHKLSATLTARASVELIAPGGVTIEGDVTIGGSVFVGGLLIDGGGNTNHHSHP
ncbi:MAG: phage baseplate assembly protein V [Candidatus Thiodiazotropha sp. (ex Epidulcina cf. delphinae)]|nr:phage baseplate assembly protein V [Candidatus Thiodiazotropha sp. (ex Epidulcina cf. delphinae)]